jgi:hypothetical protein
VQLGQLDFVEIAVERDARHSVALAQQLFDDALVAGHRLVRVAAPPQQAARAVGVVDRGRQRVHQQRALLLLVAAAVLDGARDDPGQAVQAALGRREHRHQPARQQGGADADRGRAPAARVHQHVGEALRHELGEAAEQGRTELEQAVPVELVGALAVGVVEVTRAHQVQRAAVVDPLHERFPVDRLEHLARQQRIVRAVRVDASAARRAHGMAAPEHAQLVAAGLEIFEQAGPLARALEILVQAG